MKTNVKMLSKDRELFGVVIRQDTSNSFMSITDLQEAYAVARIKNGWMSKNVSEILSGKENSERIYYVLNEVGVVNVDFSTFMNDVDNQSLVRVMKKCGAYKTSGRGDNRSVMCNPYIFALLAMELNPMIYAKVVIWLTDKLILNRIEAGNNYNLLSRAISKFKNVDYALMAKGLNYIIFGHHELQLRNKASESELKQLEDLQKQLAFAIEMGYIKSFNELMTEMRRIFSIRNKPISLETSSKY